MNITEPFWFFLLIPLVIISRYVYLKQETSLTYSNVFLSPRVWETAFLIFAVCALVRPVLFRYDQDDITGEGIDTVFMIDVSLSMGAEDAAPDRLSWVKHKITESIHLFEGQRIGIAAFSEETRILCPLTHDHYFFIQALNELQAGMFYQKGTDIYNGIHEIIPIAFDHQIRKRKEMIIFSDGETMNPKEENFPTDIRDNVIISAVVIGDTQGGSTIPVPEDPAGRVFRLENGEPIVTKANPTILKKISSSHNGSLWLQAGNNFDFTAEYAHHLEKDIYRKINIYSALRNRELFPVFTGLALMSFLQLMYCFYRKEACFE